MKKHFLRFAAALTAAVMVLAVAVGCKPSEDNLYVPPEFVYVAESIQFPEDMSNIWNIAYADGNIYFVFTDYGDDREQNPYARRVINSEIYSMSIDAPGQPVKLTGYVAPVDIPANMSGSAYINNLSVDNEGNLWVIETWNLYGYEFPEGYDVPNEWTEDAYQYYNDYGNGTAVRKLSSTGFEQLSVDISGLSKGSEYFYVNSLGVDGLGNIYLSSEDYERGGTVIYVLDNAGNPQFELSSGRWVDRFFTLPDGSAAYATDSQDEEGRYRRVLQKIDFGAKKLGETLTLPENAYQIYPGSGEYDVLINLNETIYGLTFGEEDQEPVKLLNWLESDVVNDGIQNITMTSDGRIVCTNYVWDRITYESGMELLVLTKTPYSQLPEKEVITLATLQSWDIRDAIVKFNKSNPNYRIHIIDYSEFNNEENGWQGGLTKLTTELISGKLPDILNVAGLPYKQYVAKGMLADIYPFIDADADYARGDLVEGALRAAEIDGSLYQLFPSFYVNTIIGNPSVIGSETGWTMDEFMAVLQDHPKADMPLGQWLTKMNFLQSSISYGIDDYINWGTGTVRFDTPDFILLLELAKTFPDEPDWEAIYRDDSYWDTYIPEDEAIATGRQIMSQMTLSGFDSLSYYKQLYGGEVVYKGFPNENRKGNSLSVNSGFAIIDKSKNKDAAWEFLRTTLDKDWQLSYTYGFPTNKAAFEQQAKTEMERNEDERGYISFGSSDNMYRLENPTQKDVDQIIALINSASGTAGWNVDPDIWNIISENVTDFFNGAANAQDTARIVQSRVAILVSERS